MTTAYSPAAETLAVTTEDCAESRLPRVLCVTPHVFNNVSAAIIGSNLFRGWPKDRLATITDDITTAGTDVCERYFWLTGDELVHWRPIKWLRRSSKGHATTVRTVPSANTLVVARRGTLVTLGKGLLFGRSAVPNQGRLSKRLESWIEEFGPQHLYIVPGYNGMLELGELIRRRFNLPTAIHFMDDWRSTRYRTGLLAPFARRHMLDLLAQTVRNATLRIGIGDEMCARFSSDYGVEFVPFHNPVDLAAVEPLARKDFSIGNEVRLFYSGGVFSFAQLDSLVDVCRAVTELRHRGTNVRFDIYCRAHQVGELRRAAGHCDGVSIHEPVPDWNEFFRNLCKHDVLMLPANFDRYSIDYIRYSIPGKLAEYLASGVPILVYGPDAIAQVQYAKRSGWAHVVDRRDPDALREGIRRLAVDVGERQRVATTARRLAEERYDAAIVRRRFRAAITEATSSSASQ